MKKPEIVCVVGSGIVAPTILLLLIFAGGLVAALLDIDSSQWPQWFKSALSINSMVFLPWMLWETYRWLFKHCRGQFTR